VNKPFRLSLALMLMIFATATAFAKPSEDAPTADPKRHVITPVVGRNLSYVVKPGEDLYVLGLRHKLAIEHLMWANGLTSEQVKSGTRIVIPLQHVLPATLDNGLIINLPERGVYLFKNHECVAFYPCAIGMGGRFATPTGDTRIVNKQMNPTWDPPEWANQKEPVGPGPNNPLGDRWIGLGIPGVGLHGTTQPMSIGQNASHGCMRMYPAVIRELFEEVNVGMPVRIMYETVKVGVSSEDGQVYLQTYPDVYAQAGDRATLIREKLEHAGLSEFVDDEQLKRLVADKSGLPQHVLGDDIVVKVNNQRVTTTVAPFVRDGQIWTSAEVLRALGAQVRLEDKVLTVSLNGKTVRFDGEPKEKAPAPPVAPASPAAPETTSTPLPFPSTSASAEAHAVDPKVESLAYTPRRFNGKSLVPVKPVLQSFGLTFKWVPKFKTLLIYTAHATPGS